MEAATTKGREGRAQAPAGRMWFMVIFKSRPDSVPSCANVAGWLLAPWGRYTTSE